MQIEQVDPQVVPHGRGTSPLLFPIQEIVDTLTTTPNSWFLIGIGDTDERQRLSNAGAMLRSGRYLACKDHLDNGKFEVRVSGAKDAYHASDYAVGVFARFVPAA